jgi:hypothetical protein
MTREERLKLAERAMVPWITTLAYTYPANTRISCGFPKSSRGRGNHAIGQCWTSRCSADQTAEIFISPTQANAARVCDILLHEMVHATVGVEHGHKKPFITLARALGLHGKITATVAGPDLEKRIVVMLESLPAYPHAELKPSEFNTPKQKTALLKVQCEECGYVARVTAKWLNNVGAPICPCNNEPMSTN